jgi:TRAP-type uncharacterized transport system substrate-binding protein
MKNRILRWSHYHTLLLFCCVGFVALGVWLAVPRLIKQETPVLRMSAGPDSTRRHAVAVYLSEQAARNDLALKLVNSAGSEDCLNRLKAGQLDVAIVSNGITVPDDDGIAVLAAVQLEAVHILVRKELADGDYFAEMIRGKRVNLGEQGSTDWQLARELLKFVRLRLPSTSQPGDVIPTEFGKTELVNKTRAILEARGAKKDSLIAEMPDCLLVLETTPSTVVQQLIEAVDYRIVPLPATRAFLQDNLQNSESSTTVLEREFLEPTQIATNSYFKTRGYPAADCDTIGVRLLIVARESVPARAVRPLMQTLFEREFSHRILPKSPRDIATPYAIHPAAIAYLDRNKPLAVQETMESVNDVFSIFGAFSAGALSLYGLLWKWRKRTRKPSDYFAEIRKVELLAYDAETDSMIPVRPGELVKYLDDRLLALRQGLIEDICEGRIKGDQVIANILALLQDARRNLPRLDGQATDPGGLTQRSNRQAA